MLLNTPIFNRDRDPSRVSIRATWLALPVMMEKPSTLRSILKHDEYHVHFVASIDNFPALVVCRSAIGTLNRQVFVTGAE